MAKAVTYVYRAVVESVHDGDTWTALIDLGFDVSLRYNIRMLGMNAIELADPGGKEARSALIRLVPLKSTVTLQSMSFDKYGGRADCAVTNAAGLDVTAEMIRLGWAAAWDGQGAKPTPAWPRK